MKVAALRGAAVLRSATAPPARRRHPAAAAPRAEATRRPRGLDARAAPALRSGLDAAAPELRAALADAGAQLRGLLPARGAAPLDGGGALDERATAAAPPLGLPAEALAFVGLATAVAFICSVDRAAMSVAVLPMAEQYGWGADAKGAIGASFFIGYTVSNFGCILAARLPAKGVLAAGVAMWSAFTLATPAAAAAAAAAGLGPLLAARAAMGVGEGVAYPAIQSLVHDRVPAAARSRALALIYSGHQLGSLASLGAAPPLIAALGWPAVFFCFGSLGFVWLAAWVPVMRVGAPDEAAVEEGSGKPALLAALLAALPAAPAPAPVALADVPWRRFAASKPFWAIVAAQVSAGVGSCLSFSWLPTFYSDVYGVDVAGAAAAAVVPFAGTVVATNAAGWIADGLINNRVLSLTATRKAMQAVASLGPAACLLKLAADQAGGGAGGPPAGGVGAAVAVVTAWLALGGFSAAGYGSNHQDLGGRRYAGVLFGLCNGLASLAGSASIYATGQVLRETHSWALIFESAAAVHVLGAAVYLLWASADEADSFERDEPLRG